MQSMESFLSENPAPIKVNVYYRINPIAGWRWTATASNRIYACSPNEATLTASLAFAAAQAWIVANNIK